MSNGLGNEHIRTTISKDVIEAASSFENSLTVSIASSDPYMSSSSKEFSSDEGTSRGSENAVSGCSIVVRCTLCLSYTMLISAYEMVME